jgi:hypothetical protein
MMFFILETPWDLISAFIVLILGWLLCTVIGRALKINLLRASAIYYWHTIFSFIYLYYVYSFGGDAFSYYMRATTWEGSIAVGTQFIIYLNYILIHIFELSILGCFVFFNLFGALGLLILDSALNKDIYIESPSFSRFIYFLPFLPSISFWSSAIGKDSLSFLSVCLFGWILLNLTKRKPFLIVSILLMLVVRPHIALIMVVSLGLGYVLSNHVKLIEKLVLSTGMLASAWFLIPFTLNYTGLNDVNNLGSYVAERQSYNTQGGGGIDLTAMSTPEQIFAYLFRPLPFEANSAMSFVSSMENLLLLMFFCACVYIKPKTYIKTQINKKALVIYSIISVVLLSMTTANLGIAVRQKLMILPVIFLILMTLRAEVDNDK